MKDISTNLRRPPPRVERYTWALAVGWMVIVTILLVGAVAWEREGTLEAARIQARAIYEKDLIYRRWNIRHGGVYVPITEETQPNPYLSHIPERDIRTPSDKLLTLMNSEYMARQVFELARKEYGIHAHLTSLHPLRSENAPDPWETKALQALERGETEISSLEELKGVEYMRLIRPLITEERCLECHEGYQVGDIRGGFSVSVRMVPLWAIARKNILTLVLGYLIVGLLGLGAIGVGGLRLKQRIRERDQAEEKIRRQGEFLENVFESIRQPFYVIDANDYTIKMANSAACLDRLTGNETCYALIHRCNEPCRGMEYPCTLEEAKRTSKPVTVEHIHYDREGNAQSVEVHGYPVFDNEGNIFQLIEYCYDISERVQAEEALQESEKRYAEAEQLGHFGHWARNFVKNTATWSKGTYRILGLDPNQSPQLSYEDFLNMVHPGDRKYLKSAAETALSRGEKLDIEYRIIRADGMQRIIHSVGEVRFDESGQPTSLVGTIHDITERKQVEQELVRLERLRALAEMSGGVCHNLNNILTAIMGPAQLLQEFTDNPNVLRQVEVILASTRRASDLVHRLHLATRGVEEGELTPVQVNKVVQEAVQTARPRWQNEPEARGITIAVVTNLEEVPFIRGTESRLHDLLINLIFNAVDAMPGGGTITISTQAVEEDVQLTVSDTGMGMDEETRRRVFEPFFTTKMDVGSGLGLSTAYSTVTHWGGHIDVESTPGKGTTFTIWLPAWKGPVEEKEERVQPGQVRRGKLLVVEDEEAVCQLLSNLLGDHHEVETVLTGREALEKFASGRYDVGLIDLGLPGIPGDWVAQEMRQMDPAAVAVLITGWELLQNDPRIAAFDFHIQKPFAELNKVKHVVAQAIKLHDARTEIKN